MPRTSAAKATAASPSPARVPNPDRKKTDASPPASSGGAIVIPLSRIVKRSPPVPEKDAPPVHPAGIYRVIHGRVAITLPKEMWTKSNGERDYDKPTQEFAKMGDEVWLNEQDATSMVNASIVEPLDAKPSRVGRVWDPPKTANRIF